MKSAYIIKIDPEKISQYGGIYQRVYFRDLENPNINYILDVTNSCKQWKSYLEIGNYFTHLDVFKNQRTDKIHINGKATFIYEGKVVKQKSNVGFEI